MAARVHDLKTVGVYWDAVKAGDKTFEVRKNDRFFQPGDIVRLLRCDSSGKLELGSSEDDEQDPANGYWGDDDRERRRYSRRVITRTVGVILQGGQFGIEPGYCVFALQPLPASAPSVEDSQ